MHCLLYGDERWQPIAGPRNDVGKWLVTTHRPRATLKGSGSLVTDDAGPVPLPPVDGDTAPLTQDHLPEEVVGRSGRRRWFTVVDGRGERIAKVNGKESHITFATVPEKRYALHVSL